MKKTGDTMTGTLTSASTNNAIIFKGLENCDITNFYTMNGTLDSNSRLAIRNGLRFNWYDTYWYIGNIRGESTDSNGFGIANESHKLCLQVTPNNTIAPVFRSTASQGTAPLIVNSTTQVSNLNADLLDGYHAFGTSNALIKYGYTVSGTEPAWCRIATYSIRNTEIMTDVCFVLHSSFSDLFGLLVVKTRGTAVVEGLLIASYNINRSNIRIYHDAEKKNIELYCYGGSNYSIIQANLLYSHDRNGVANTNITLYRADTKAPSWSTYVNPGFVNLQNSSEVAKKLQTPRTLWGQSFDGSANVSGNMTGVGSINMSGQLTSTVASGTAPFIVASNTVVGNLNADLLDGLHAERFLLSVGRSDGTFDLNTYSERAIKEIRTTEQTTNNAPFAGYGLLANLWDSNKFAALQIGGTSTDLFFRGKHDGTNKITSAWHRLLHTENYASIADGRYVKKAGDTMRGALHLANGTRNNAGDDCGFGNCNIGGCLGLQGLNGATGLAFIQQGASWSGGNNYKFTWNGSNMVSSSTALWNNLNADMLDNWHLNFLPRNYNIGRCYAVRFALGGEDNGWKKIFACSESGATPYRSVTVWGRIWYAYGNHAQSEVWNYHFCAIFYMRSNPSSSDSSVGNVENSARLFLPTFAKGMDNIRLVRVGTNNFELQVRQIGSWHNANIEYQYNSYGCNVSAWENLQSTSNTSVAVSARDASTLADSRASSADVLTTSRTLWGRPFNGSSNIDGNIDNAAVITSKGGIWLDLKGSSGVAFYSGGSLCAVMNNTGVGIGTSSPSQKLHVAGNIIATGAITAKASSSDIRLKTDIQGYDAMGIIRKFRSVKYHWNAIAKENSEVFNHDNWNYGLIAQDLLSGGYTQWVKDIFNDYYTIDYERLIPVVWKGLQEVDDEVTRLKKRVKELENRLGINNK